MFWLVLEKNKIGRYPKAKKIDAHIYHYGWVRSQEQMNLKSQKVQKYWNSTHKEIDYTQFNYRILKEFKGTHPKIVKNGAKRGRSF